MCRQLYNHSYGCSIVKPAFSALIYYNNMLQNFEFKNKVWIEMKMLGNK